MPEEEMGFAGKLKVQVVPDLTGFGAALRAKLVPLTKGLTAKVGLEIDSKGARASVSKAIQEATAGQKAKVEVELDNAALKAGLPSSGEAIQLQLDLDTAAVHAKIEEIERELENRGERTPVLLQVDLDDAAARTRLAELESELSASDRRIEIQIGLDAAAARAELQALADRSEEIEVDVDLDSAGFRAKLAALTAQARKKINIDVDTNDAENRIKSMASSVGQLNRQFTFLRNVFSLFRIPLLISGLQLAAQAMNALAAAAMGLAGALQAAAGALAALPGLLSAVAQAATVAFLAFGGIGKALKAMGDQAIKGGGAAAGGANKAAQALQRQEDAAERVEDATRSLARAQRDAAKSNEEAAEQLSRAQEDLARAQIDASRDIADAERRVEDAERSLARAVEDLAEARRDAARDLIDSNRRVEDAERDLVRAKESALDAEEALTEARERAIERLEDLQLATGDLAVQEMKLIKERALAQREVLATANNPRQNEAARIRLAEIEQDLKRVALQRQRNAEDLAEFDATGIEGSDEVRNAQDRLEDSLRRIEDAERNLLESQERRIEAGLNGQQRIADAIQRVADEERDLAEAREDRDFAHIDAQRRLEDALRDVSDAQENVTDTMIDGAERVEDAQRALDRAIRDAARALDDMGASGGGAMSALDQAMARLPKSAQDFVRFLFSLKPLLDELKKSAADNLFPGLTEGIKSVLPLFPIFNQGVKDTAKVLGDLAAEAGAMIGGWGPDIKALIDQNVVSIRDFGHAGMNLATALKDIMVEAIPLVDWFGKLALQFSEWVKNLAASGRETGALRDFFRETREVLSQLFDILGNVAGALWNTLTQGRDLGKDLLTVLQGLTQKWVDWTQSAKGENAIKKWFDDARPAIDEMGRLIGGIFDLFKDVSSLEDGGFVAIIKQIRTELLPVLGELFEAVKSGFTPAVIGAIASFGKLLAQILEHSGGMTLFVKAFGGIAGAIAKIIEFVPGLGEFLGIMAGIKGTLLAFKVAGAAFTALTSITPIITSLIGAFWKLNKIFRIITVGFNVLKLALLSHPFIAIGVAIATLVFLVIKHWDTIKEVIGNAWQWIKDTTERIWNAIWDFLFGGSIIPDIFNAFTEWFNRIKDWIAQTWDNIKQRTSDIWNGIKDFFSNIWNNIKDVFSNAVQAVASFLQERWNVMRSNVENAWNWILNFLSGLWNGIKNIASSVFNAMRDVIEGVWNSIRNGVSNAWNWVKDTITNTINSAKDSVSRAVEAVIGFFQRLWEKAQYYVKKIKDAINSLPFIGQSPIPMVVWSEKTFKGLMQQFTKMRQLAVNTVKEFNEAWRHMENPQLEMVLPDIRALQRSIHDDLMAKLSMPVPSIELPQLQVPRAAEQAIARANTLADLLRELISKIEEMDRSVNLNFNEGSIVSQHPDDIATPIAFKLGRTQNALSAGRI